VQRAEIAVFKIFEQPLNQTLTIYTISDESCTASQLVSQIAARRAATWGGVFWSNLRFVHCSLFSWHSSSNSGFFDALSRHISSGRSTAKCRSASFAIKAVVFIDQDWVLQCFAHIRRGLDVRKWMYACVEIEPNRRLLADRTGRGSRELVYLSQSIRSKFMHSGPSGCFGLIESKPDSLRPWLEVIWTIEKPPFPRWSKS